MLSLILGLLTSIAPLITSAGLTLINLFASDQQAKQQAMKDFLSSIQQHLNDALASVNSRTSAAGQVSDLDAQDQIHDNPPPPDKGQTKS